jgi:hypothetical protein
LKDWLIERILVRWWYIVEWPPTSRPVVEVPEGYKEMEHYPYMFIHETSGRVLNKRETEETTPPCYKVLHIDLLNLKANTCSSFVCAALV